MRLRLWSCQNTERRSGWKTGRPNCCPLNTFAWSSPFRRKSPASPSTTRKWSTAFSSAPLPRLFSPSRAIRSICAEIGFFAILHTWRQNLHHHPHVHCVVPGGGLSPDYERWIGCKPGFFLPARVLSRLFRRLFFEALGQAFTDAKLQFFGEIEALKDSSALPCIWRPCAKKNGLS